MIGDERFEGAESSGSLFATTQWSVVLTAGQQTTPQSAEALEKLCRAYWQPLYVYVRRRGYNLEDAQDLTQKFFERFLKKQSVELADPARGRFRTFLLKSLQCFLSDEWKHACRIKRGGGISNISIDANKEEESMDIPDTLTPERVYEQRWAIALLDKVLDSMREEHARAGKSHLMEALQEFLWGTDGSVSYAQIAVNLSLTEGAVRVAVHRLRQQFQDRLRSEVAQTVGSPDEIDEELRYLIGVIRG